MRLTPRELDKLRLHNAGLVAQQRLARGLRLNHPEAIALIVTVLMELIREGKHSCAVCKCVCVDRCMFVGGVYMYRGAAAILILLMHDPSLSTSSPPPTLTHTHLCIHTHLQQLMDLGRTFLGQNQVLPGVASLLHEVQIEATFPDGTKLVTVHTPIAREDGDLTMALHGSFCPVPAVETLVGGAEEAEGLCAEMCVCV